jgi:light-harvesting complex I chlorophyll a/b binding protein 2
MRVAESGGGIVVFFSKVASGVGAARTSFLGGKALRVSRIAAAAKGDTTVSAVAAPNSDRPLWLPGSQAPEWLDGRCT